jgi:hypothetical protein
LRYWKKPKEKKKDKPTELTSEKMKKKKRKRRDSENKNENENEKKSGDKNGKKSKKIKIHVMSMDGDTIRTFSQDVKEGLNKITWRMNRDGVRYPSRNEPKKDADPPGGPSVLPGKYKLVTIYKAIKDSMELEVFGDPRINLTNIQLKAKDEAIRDFEKLVERASRSFGHLMEAKKTIKRVDQSMVNAVDSVKTNIAKDGKEIQKKINELSKLYMDAPDQKGIQRDKKTLVRSLRTASGLLGASDGAPNQNAIYAVNNAKQKLQTTLDKVNHFLMNDWKEYQEKVEAVKRPLFKIMEPVEIE